MNKIKASLLVLLLATGLVLLGTQATWAYQFTYLGSEFFSQSGANAGNGVDSMSDGPHVATNSSHASTSSFASVSYVATGSGGYGQWSAKGSTANVQVSSDAWGSSSTLDGSGSAYGTAVTTTAGYTTGIFFRLTGGTTGEQVRVNYAWSASVINQDGGTATLGGGFATPMYISLNEYPAGTPANPVWHKDRIDVGPDSMPAYNESGYFMAQVGDIIGINLSADANIGFSGAGSNFYASAYNSMDLEAAPLPPAAWLLGSGLLGLLGWRRVRPGRQ